MEPWNLVVGLMNIGTAALIMGTAVPMWLGKVPMNRWYGVRLTKSFASERAWHEINARGGRELFWWSVPILLAGIAALFVPITGKDETIIALLLTTGIITIFVGIAVVRILIHANRYSDD